MEFNYHLIHGRLSMTTFSIFSNTWSTFSIFRTTFDILVCVNIDVITKKQNAKNPEYRLYESINWRTKFFVSSVLISRFTIHRWKTAYPTAWHTVSMVPNFDGRICFSDSGFMHKIFATTWSGSNAFLNLIMHKDDKVFSRTLYSMTRARAHFETVQQMCDEQWQKRCWVERLMSSRAVYVYPREVWCFEIHMYVLRSSFAIALIYEFIYHC